MDFLNKYEVVIAQLDTALGVLPTIIGEKVFDVSSIDVGRIIAMNAFVKTDFSNGKYSKPNTKQQLSKPSEKQKSEMAAFTKGEETYTYPYAQH